MGKLRAINAPDKFREALATAIATRNEMRERSLEAHAAQRRAQEALDAALQRADAASRAVDQARADHALAHTAAASSGGKPPLDKTLRAARSEAEVARDDAEAAEVALRTLTEACTEPDDALRKAERIVLDAANAIVAQRAAPLLAEAEQLAQKLAGARLELFFVRAALHHCDDARRRRIISEHDDTSAAVALLNAEPPDTTGAAIDRFLAASLFAAENTEWRSHPRLQAWHDALRELQHDASAELPS
jgi:hypothetical protein